MSDQVKQAGFSRFYRSIAMGAMMVVVAGAGAAIATYLQTGKSLSSEGNHSVDKEAPQAAANDLPESHAQSLTAVSHDNVPENGSYSHKVAGDNTHKQTDTDPDPSFVDADEQSMPTSKHPAEIDPFSDEALGFEASFPAATPVESHPSDAQSETARIVHAEDAPHSVDTDLHGDDENSHVANVDREAVATSNSHAERSAAVRKEQQARIPRVPESTGISRQDKVTQQTVNFMALADEDLAGGNYVQAMQAYQALRQKSEGPPGAALLFRLALCAEAAGRHASAIEAYRKISGTQTDPAWAGVARYGEARCLSALKRHEGLQTDLLRRAVLDETEFLPTVRTDVLHLIGRDLWRQQTSTSSTDLLDDRTLIVPAWSADPIRLLDELPMLVHETPTKPGPIEFQVLNFGDATPDGVFVRLNCGMTRVETLLRNLITGCELQCEVSDAAAELLKGRTQQIHVTERSLALLLDGITISSGLAWTVEEKLIRIMPFDELTAEQARMSRLNAAERILRIAVMEGPNSPQIGHSRLALSTLLFEQKRAADAVQFLQVHIETSPRSIVETEAAFNLGKCLMILDQRDDAKQSFLRSIDSSGGLIDVKIASYIFHSRMLLEDNQGKLATTTMMRGLSLSKGSDMEPFAALQLASVHLILDNPQGANSVLMAYRDELADGPGREGGAFVSALARFRAAVLADRREREGAAVVSAMTEFKPEKYCGGHWGVLAAGACDELGQTQQSTEAYVKALKRLPVSDLRNKTILKLARLYQDDNQLEEARLLLATLSSSEVDTFALQARLRSAAVSLELNRPDEAILCCRQLINSTTETEIVRAALRIMGRAYERKKNHQAAVYCFAGVLPEDEAERDQTTSHDQSTTIGGH